MPDPDFDTSKPGAVVQEAIGTGKLADDNRYKGRGFASDKEVGRAVLQKSETEFKSLGGVAGRVADNMATSRAAVSTINTFKQGFADKLVEHATALLAQAHRIKNNAEVTIEGEFQGLELGLQDLAAHIVQFKKVLVP